MDLFSKCISKETTKLAIAVFKGNRNVAVETTISCGLN
jgi:hypothetical protein